MVIAVAGVYTCGVDTETIPTDVVMAEPSAQSVAEFARSAAETFDRLDCTGEAEALTLAGRRRGVLLSAETYAFLVREAQMSLDCVVMQRSIQQHREGKSLPVDEAFDRIRAEVLATLERQRPATEPAGAAGRAD